MRKEKAFYAVLITAIAVGLFDLAYIVYVIRKVIMILNGNDVLTSSFWSFSIAVIIANSVTAVITALYLLLRNKRKKVKEYVRNT